MPHLPVEFQEYRLAHLEQLSALLIHQTPEALR